VIGPVKPHAHDWANLRTGRVDAWQAVHVGYRCKRNASKIGIVLTNKKTFVEPGRSRWKRDLPTVRRYPKNYGRTRLL